MPGSNPQTGDVYYYPYIWKRQGPGADSEKDRPCAVALRLTSGAFRGADTFMVALTQSGYPEDGFGEIVPEDIVKTLKRLDSSKPTYLITSEINGDISDKPSFEDCEYLGTLPMEWFKPVILKLIPLIKSGTGEINQVDS